MPVHSMTGFARMETSSEDCELVWELRSVNGKGFDLRLRLPAGLESLESDLRRMASERFKRGNVQANLQLKLAEDRPNFVVNEAMLSQILALSGQLVADGHASPPSADGILSIKGILDVADKAAGGDAEKASEALQNRNAAILSAFETAAQRLLEARRQEGEALGTFLTARLDEIEALVARAEADPARSPEAIRDRLAGQVAQLTGDRNGLDPDRLHQEAAILAAKADIREELDRLAAHVAAARGLLAEGGAVGRRLDFLSQEFNRESNTICSKSNAASLTAIGLELKVVTDQFREQVQNLE